MAAVERLPVLYHSADYISFPLGSLDPLWYIWRWSSAHVYTRGRKQCCKLHYCLWRVAIKPRLPLSDLWCVLCFQRQSFWRLFKFVPLSVLVSWTVGDCIDSWSLPSFLFPNMQYMHIIQYMFWFIRRILQYYVFIILSQNEVVEGI